MKTSCRGLIRFAAFLLGFALLLLFADYHLIQTNTFSSLTLREIRERDDIELAVVGSSVAKYHFNPDIMDEVTGRTSFNVSVMNASFPASIAILQEMYRTNHPKYVVVICEPYNFYTVQEATEAYYNLAPFMSNPRNMAEYLLRASREDGLYLNRLLMMREFGVSSLSDIVKTVGLRYFPDTTYASIQKTMDPTISYMGRGYMRFDTDERVEETVRKTCFREYTGYQYSLYDGSKRHIQELKALCDAEGSELILVGFPTLTVHALAEPGFADYNDSLASYCREMDIPFFNFAYAKPELMENLDSYFFDLHHMTGEGGDKLTRAFSEVFNAYVAGEDVSDLFYPNRWAYYDSVNWVTNTWITFFEAQDESGEETPWNLALEQDEARVRELAKEQDVYLADCNHTAIYTPVYRFVLVDEDGTEVLLQDYGVDTLYTCERGALTGKTLRVYARLTEQDDSQAVYYDLADDSNLD